MQLEMHSQDGICARILKRAHVGSCHARILRRTCKSGLARWLICGFAVAGGSSVAFAADLSAPVQNSDQISDPNSLQVLRALDAQTLPRGWDVPFPTYEDSLFKNDGGWRSTLAQYGFGFVDYNVAIAGVSMLNTPSVVPNRAPYVPCTAGNFGLCQGRPAYFGERPEAFDYNSMFLTYDLSRLGVPDGQLTINSIFVKSSMQSYEPDGLQLSALSWYQTLFDKKLEIKFGYMDNSPEWGGILIGGNYASTFGVSASTFTELGMSVAATTTPSFKTVWHITDELYNQTLVQRSLPVNGPSGNPLYDEVHANPTGFEFFSSVPGTGVLYADEIGYKKHSTPDNMFTWLRFGAMFNTSAYTDFTQLLTHPGATRTGNNGMYFLADRQLLMIDPTQGSTYRGIYAGVSAMYANPDLTPFAEYFEGRLYGIGVIPSRPTDMISLVYARNEISSALADATNLNYAATGIAATHSTNSVTLTYLAHLMPGVHASAAVSYTDNPSLTYFQREGHSVEFLSSLVTNW